VEQQASELGSACRSCYSNSFNFIQKKETERVSEHRIFVTCFTPKLRTPRGRATRSPLEQRLLRHGAVGRAG